MNTWKGMLWHVRPNIPVNEGNLKRFPQVWDNFSTKQKGWLRRGKFPREGMVNAWRILSTVKVIKTELQSQKNFQGPLDSRPQLARWLHNGFYNFHSG